MARESKRGKIIRSLLDGAKESKLHLEDWGD